MRALSWSLILLALISCLWAWIVDLAHARSPIKMGTSVPAPQVATQRTKYAPVHRTATPPVKCITNDLGKWGSERIRIKTTKCGVPGGTGTQVTLVGKWNK